MPCCVNVLSQRDRLSRAELGAEAAAVALALVGGADVALLFDRAIEARTLAEAAACALALQKCNLCHLCVPPLNKLPLAQGIVQFFRQIALRPRFPLHVVLGWEDALHLRGTAGQAIMAGVGIQKSVQPLNMGCLICERKD